MTARTRRTCGIAARREGFQWALVLFLVYCPLCIIMGALPYPVNRLRHPPPLESSPLLLQCSPLIRILHLVIRLAIRQRIRVAQALPVALPLGALLIVPRGLLLLLIMRSCKHLVPLKSQEYLLATLAVRPLLELQGDI